MQTGEFVLVHLIEPNERVWGRLSSLKESGVVVRGIDVGQIETFKFQFKRGERQVFTQTVFFPMRRIQKIDLDEPVGAIPSVIQAVLDISGLDEDAIME
jgi:hypothetical protein